MGGGGSSPSLPLSPIRFPTPESAIEDHELKTRILSELRQQLGVDQPREGIHTSELIYCLRKNWTIRKLDLIPGGRTEYLGETPDEQMLVWAIGHSHEAIFAKGKIRGDPVERDGVIGSLDFWTPADQADEVVLTEMKSTRASAKKGIEEMGHYIAQLATYCYIHGIREGHIFVLHIMGDYAHQTKEGRAKGLGPHAIMKVWKVRFTQVVLDRWWAEVQRRKEILLSTDMPGADPYFEWECGYCAVRELIHCEGSASWQAKALIRQQTQDIA